MYNAAPRTTAVFSEIDSTSTIGFTSTEMPVSCMVNPIASAISSVDPLRVTYAINTSGCIFASDVRNSATLRARVACSRSQ